MKFYTPTLLEAVASDDPAIARAGHEEWERATASYTRRLLEIDGLLTKPVRRLANLPLHDARVVAYASKENRFFMLLELDTEEPGHGLQLRYHLLRPPQAVRHSPAFPDEPLVWLYDEFDAKEVDGGVTVFEHSILLSRGTELRLTFYEISLCTLKGMYIPSSHDASLEYRA